MRKISAAFAVHLLILGCLVNFSSLNIREGHGQSTHHVGGSSPDFDTIQAAINAAGTGDTIIVHSGTYDENVVVNKSLTLTGQGRPLVDAEDDDYAILVSADGCTVQGFNVTNGSWWRACIRVESDNNVIRDNHVFQGWEGIRLEGANGTTVELNDCGSLYSSGIYLEASHANTIRNNTCWGMSGEAGYGIGVSGSQENVLYFNDLDYATEVSKNALDDTGENTWYSAALQRGNRYSDYSGSDPDGDGVGNTPYDIPSGPRGFLTQDLYPLMPSAPPVQNPPSISGVHVGEVGQDQARVNWVTNQWNSDNRVLYGESPGLSGGSWSDWCNGTDAPVITITGLASGTTYYYSCFSHNGANPSLYSNSSIGSFTTLRETVVWHVDDDLGDYPDADFTEIQAAVDASVDGDTIIVHTGTYAENLVVERRLNLRGVGTPTVDGHEAGDAFHLKESGCVVEGFEITAGIGWSSEYVGIRVGYGVIVHPDCGNATIRDNHIHGCNYGVYIDWNSKGSWITNNTFQGNMEGVSTYRSDHNVIHDNCFTGNSEGIHLVSSSHNNVTDCLFANNTGTKANSLEVKMPTLNEVSEFNRIEGCTFVNDELYLQNYVTDCHVEGNEFSIAKDTPSLDYYGLRVRGERIHVVGNVITGMDIYTMDNTYGIRMQGAEDCVLEDNSVSLMNRGISLEQSSRITMRGNTMEDNLYNLELRPQASAGQIGPDQFDHDIDPSNLVDGDRVYYIVGASDEVYDISTLPDIGFLACVDCDNIAVRDLILNGNSHGVIMYNVVDSTVENVYLWGNLHAGLALYSCEDVTVRDSWLRNNGDADSWANFGLGMYLYETDDCLVTDSDVSNNWKGGLELDRSDGNEIYRCTILDNGVNTPSSGGIGIRLITECSMNTVHNNTVKATSTVTQKYGIHTQSSGNTFYNNYVNCTVNAYDWTGGENWNIAKTPGTNIIGGPYLGGNYWDDYAGGDVDYDGLGDNMIPYDSNGGISSGGDYHPLTTRVVNDTVAPTIILTSPEEGETYSQNYVYLDASSPDGDISEWWFTINGGPNTPYDPPSEIVTDLEDGDYVLTLYARDTSGNTASVEVSFAVEKSEIEQESEDVLEEVPDEDAEFNLIITSPMERTYTERSIDFSFESPLPLYRASYILNSGKPVETSEWAHKEFDRLPLGKYTLKVNGEDPYGRLGNAKVDFEVIPLTLGEAYELGAPEFWDEVAFSFMGEAVDHMVSFEVKDLSPGELGVYVNKHLVGEMGVDPSLGEFIEGGAKIGEVGPASQWTSIQLDLPGELIVPGVENLISFVHATNPHKAVDLSVWRIRNVTIRPLTTPILPEIRVFALDKAVSDGETLSAFVRISGVAEGDEYDAYIYIIDPEGGISYYPDWGETPQPLDPFYVESNYYGRLPGSLEFTNRSVGTHILVGKLTPRGTTTPVALSTDKIYYDNATSLKVYVNRGILTDGRRLVVEYAVTGGVEPANGSLALSIETPSGRRLCLPDLDEGMKTIPLEPIESRFATAYDGLISSAWEEGPHILRGSLFSEDGETLSWDLATFQVSREPATLSGDIVTPSTTIIHSRLILIDQITLETVAEDVRSGEAITSYEITVPPGLYYLYGELFGSEGEIHKVSLKSVTLEGGEDETLNIFLGESLGRIKMSWLPVVADGKRPGVWAAMYHPEASTVGVEEIQDDGGEGGCSKPKIYVRVNIAGAIVAELLAEYPGDTPETLARFFSITLTKLLQSGSTGADITAYGDVLDALTDLEEQMKAQPKEEFAPQGPSSEYVVDVGINRLGEGYLLGSVTMDMDLFKVVQRASTSVVPGIEDGLEDLAGEIGDLGEAVRSWEEANPLPPRGPSLSVLMEPESVSPEKNKMTISVKMRNCKGEPVPDARVYFQQYTDRGEITAGGMDSEYSGFLYQETDGEGVARVTYTLTQGVKAGVDKVSIFTLARGNNRATRVALVKITGISLEMTAEKSVIAPRESTKVFIDLFKEELGGSRTPLAGESVILRIRGLDDATVTPAHEATTNQEGRATLTVKAGDKEGLIKITALARTALDYGDDVEDFVEIEVKPHEYIVDIRWEDALDLSDEYRQNFYGGNSQGSWTYSMSTETTWDEMSGKEVTEGRLSLDWDLNSFYWERYAWSKCEGWSGDECTDSLLLSFRVSCPGYLRDRISSEIVGQESINQILKKDAVGNLYVKINPVPIPFPLEGEHQRHYDWTELVYAKAELTDDWYLYDSDYRTGDEEHDYHGYTHRPPTAMLGVYVALANNPKLWGAPHYPGDEFDGSSVRISKTGENSYQTFSVSYTLDKNGWLYYGWLPNLHLPGTWTRDDGGAFSFYSESRGEWYVARPDDYHLYYALVFERQFTITVVEK